MILDYSKLVGKKVKLLCAFPGIAQSIYYDGEIISSNEADKIVTIRDRFNKIVHLDSDTIKQVVEL